MKPGRARLWRTLMAAPWRHHPWRQAAAVAAVALGVALAFAVHLINASALAEFDQAVRTVNGQADLSLRAPVGGWFDEALYERVAAQREVEVASPMVEVDTLALAADGERVSIKVLGIDALVAPRLGPALLPRPRAGAPRLAVVDPAAVFLNPGARRALAGGPARGHGAAATPDAAAAGASAAAPVADPRAAAAPPPGHAASAADAPPLRLQAGAGFAELRIEGDVAAPGPPLAVLDIASAQAHFGALGRLNRIDLRLAPGVDRAAWLRTLALPPGVRAAPPDEAQQRAANLSRSYRINLTVLALVALFTGAFLVFTVQALSTAQRQVEIALLGVLGLGAAERRGWLLAEAALIGALGAGLGLAVGTGLASAALHWLGGDLGNGPFGGLAPALHWSTPAAALYAALGMAAAVVGGWVPARAAERLAPAVALKGQGADAGAAGLGRAAVASALLLALGVALAFLPPWGELPLAAYLGVAALLVGGIAAVPVAVAALLRAVAPSRRHPVALLAARRAHHQHHVATAAVAGVVASLSLAVALTVMVASFRGSVAAWLDQVLPADLYLRSAVGSQQSDQAFLPAGFADRAAALPGVLRVQPQRSVALQFDPTRPSVALLARDVAAGGANLPLVGPAIEAPAGAAQPGVYVSETFAALYGATAGQPLALPLPDGRRLAVQVRGVWRDYARQHGAIAIARTDWLAATDDARVNDLAVWLREGADAQAVSADLQRLAGAPGAVDVASAADIRAVSLRIFDRSFAVTRWLQIVALGIGLAGIAASFSAQVLARRKEFGVLQHLGLTRAQVLALVAGEGALWTACGALLGLALGLAVAVVLVHVVNPQSFHWSMELRAPWAALGAMAAAVVAAGSVTAWLAARSAAARPMALAVKEDW